ncbi:hypothetical protein SEA_BEUFFERT_208 [Streptomyces phage Beuffert]|nr:hypothetical protein SEA_BEUFFERT_208 [Streptomyces phage Beuffert]
MVDGELITDITVWFGIREPEWWPEDEDDFEDRAILSRNISDRKRKPIRIRL